MPGRKRDRARRKSQLKVVRTDRDDFAESVQRDLDSLPTIEEPRSLTARPILGTFGSEDRRVREDPDDALRVLRLLEVGDDHL